MAKSEVDPLKSLCYRKDPNHRAPLSRLLPQITPGTALPAASLAQLSLSSHLKSLVLPHVPRRDVHRADSPFVPLSPQIIILKAQLASESKTASNASPSVNSGLLPLVSPVESLAKSSGRVQGRLGGASGGRQWDVELTDRLNVIQERVADCQARVGGMLHATAMSSHAQYEAKAGR